MNRPITPEDVLPDGASAAAFGTTGRKGTVTAFVANAKLLETLSEESPDHPAIVDQLRSLLPGLRAVGVLDVFAPRLPAIGALIAEQATITSP